MQLYRQKLASLLVITCGLLIFFGPANAEPEECATITQCAKLIVDQVGSKLPRYDRHVHLISIVKVKFDTEFGVESAHIVTGSGDSGFDKSVLEAIQFAAPFTQLRGLSPEDKALFSEINLNVSNQ